MDDFAVERAPVCRCRFGQLVPHPVWQTELKSIRSAARSSCHLWLKPSGSHTCDGFRWVGFFLGHVRPPRPNNLKRSLGLNKATSRMCQQPMVLRLCCCHNTYVT